MTRWCAANYFLDMQIFVITMRRHPCIRIYTSGWIALVVEKSFYENFQYISAAEM